MKSNVEVMGHPLHPVLVPIAIGAFIVTFVFDIAMLATGKPFWFAASFWSLLVGMCAAVFAALTGIYDYFTLRMSDGGRRQATTHFILNLLWFALFTASLIWKGAYAATGTAAPLADGTLPGYYSGVVVGSFILDLLAVVLLVASGWYGGEVVYRHGVAVLPEGAEEALAPGGGYGYRVAGAAGGERPPDEPPSSGDVEV